MYQNQKKFSLNSLNLRKNQKDRFSRNINPSKNVLTKQTSNSFQIPQKNPSYQEKKNQNGIQKQNPLQSVISFNNKIQKNCNSENYEMRRYGSQQFSTNQTFKNQIDLSQKQFQNNQQTREISTDYTIQKNSNNTQQRLNDDSIKHIKQNGNGLVNHSLQTSVKDNQLKNAENGSVYSRLSNASKRKFLRPVSLNNHEHLDHLYEKQQKVFYENQNLIKNFSSKLNSIQKNVVLNIQNNFKQKIDQVWESYIQDQQSKKVNVDFNSLNRDVECIKNIFLEQTKLKTQHFLNQLKLQKYKELYKDIEENNNKVFYLNDDVSFLMNNKFKEVQNQREEKEKKLNELKQKYLEEISKNKEELELSVKKKQQIYDQEFCFKLQQDQNLVSNTLNSALTFLHNKINNVNQKINKLKLKSQSSDYQALKNQVHQLQMEINQVKFSNQFNNLQ